MENLIGIRQIFAGFLTSRRAVTAIEYALIASLVAVAVVTGAKAIGVDLAATFTKVSTGL